MLPAALNVGMVFYGFMSEMDETQQWWKKYVKASSSIGDDAGTFTWRTVWAIVHHSIFFATVEHHFGVAENLLLELLH